MPIQDVRYKCNNCFDFDFCENCYRVYAVDKKELKTVYSTSHKAYHTFTKLILAMNSGVKDYNHNNNDDLEELKDNGEHHTKSAKHGKDTGEKGEKKRPPGRPSNKSK